MIIAGPNRKWSGNLGPIAVALLVDLGRPYISRPLNGVGELHDLAVLKVADDLQAAPSEPT